MLARRDATRGDEHVGLDPLRQEGLSEAVNVVGDDAAEDGTPARLLHRAVQGEAVRVADLPELRYPARLHELVAGGQDHHAGAWVHEGPSVAGSREHPQLGRGEPPPRLDQEVAGPRVLPRRSHVPAGGFAAEHPNDLVARDGVLDRHGAVRTGRDRRAGVDADGLASAHRGLGAVADAGPAHHAQLHLRPGRRAGDVGGPDGEAVHRRRRERRHVLLRPHVGGEDAAQRLLQVQLQGRERFDRGEDALAMVLDGDEPLAAVVIVDVRLRHHIESRARGRPRMDFGGGGLGRAAPLRNANHPLKLR